MKNKTVLNFQNHLMFVMVVLKFYLVHLAKIFMTVAMLTKNIKII